MVSPAQVVDVLETIGKRKWQKNGMIRGSGTEFENLFPRKMFTIHSQEWEQSAGCLTKIGKSYFQPNLTTACFDYFLIYL